MNTRPLAFVVVIIFIVVVVGYWHNSHPPRPKLKLDAPTLAILNGADRVQWYRLNSSEEESAGLLRASSSSGGEFDDSYSIAAKGELKPKPFVDKLKADLQQLDDPGMGAGGHTMCFDPGVAFRVWRGKDHVDALICFVCSGTDILTTEPNGSVRDYGQCPLDTSRAAFLALVHEEFPHDSALAEITK